MKHWATIFSSALTTRFLIILIGLISYFGIGIAPVQATERVPGAGLDREAGEYLSDQVWSNDDWIDVGIELITSGGTSSFELGYYATKYIVHIFFSTAVKPLEFWLRFVYEWRLTMGQRAPREFRSMTGMLLDQRLDIGWMQIYCADLSEREGWDHIFPYPWAMANDAVEAVEVDDGFVIDPPAENEPVAATAATANRAANMGDPPIEPTSVVEIANYAIKSKQSKLFESYVNHLASSGYLEDKFGIPAGAKYLDFAYSSIFGRKIHGPDGFFIDGNGKCYLLEMKWYKNGGGVLGRIKMIAKGDHVIQGSPQWLQKAMLKVKEQDPSRFDEIMRRVKGKRMERVMAAVGAIHDDFPKVAEEAAAFYAQKGVTYSDSALEKIIRNFHDPNLTRFLLENRKSTLGDDIIDAFGDFLAKDFVFGAVNKTGLKPGRIDKVGEKLKHYAEAFGRHVEDFDKKILYCAVK